MSKHFFGEREVQKLHKSCQNCTKMSQNAVYPDGEAVYSRAQDQVCIFSVFQRILVNNSNICKNFSGPSGIPYD